MDVPLKDSRWTGAGRTENTDSWGRVKEGTFRGSSCALSRHSSMEEEQSSVWTRSWSLSCRFQTNAKRVWDMKMWPGSQTYQSKLPKNLASAGLQILPVTGGMSCWLRREGHKHSITLWTDAQWGKKHQLTISLSQLQCTNDDHYRPIFLVGTTCRLSNTFLHICWDGSFKWIKINHSII